MSAVFGGQVGRTVFSDSVCGGTGSAGCARPSLGVCLRDLPIPTSSPSPETPESITTDPPAGPTAGCHWGHISQQRRCWGLGDHSLAGDPHSEPPASPRNPWGPWERATGSLWGTGTRRRRQMRGLQSLGRGTARRRSRGSPGGWGAAGLQEKEWSVNLGRQRSGPRSVIPHFQTSKSPASRTQDCRPQSLLPLD